MKKILLSIFAVMLAVFSVQAQEYSYTLAKGDGTTFGDVTWNGVEWNISADNTSHCQWDGSTSKGYQFGSGSNPCKTLTLSTSGIEGTITKIVVNTSGASSVNASFTVSVGGTQYGGSTKLTASATDYTFTGSASGEIKFSYTQTSSKAIYIKSIAVTYESAGSGEGGGETPEEPETPVEPEIPVTPEEPEFLTPGEYTDVLTIESIGVKSYTSYTSWSDVKLNSAAVYAGHSHKSYDAIQLRSSDDLSGIVTTKSGGKVKKVIVDWNSNTGSRTLQVYGKDTPYESTSDLYDENKRGTLLGSMTKGRATEVVVTGDYKYIGVRSSSSALYLNSIEIIWEVEPASYTLAVGETRYSTLSLGYDATIPQGAKAYVVSEVNGGYVTLEEVTGVIPAKEAVIIEATPGNYNFVQTTEGAAVVETNLLEGTRVDTYVAEEAYVLWNVDGEACFCKANMTDGKWLNNANKAYLPATAANGAASYSFRFGEGTTGIDEMTEQRAESKEIYDLTGRRVEAITAPGIYIVNGKKVLVK